MNAVFPLCCFALLCVTLQKISGELSPKFKIFLACGGGLAFFAVYFIWIEPFYQYLSSLTSAHASSSYFSLLFKGMGIAILVSVSSGICRDLGEEGIAGKLEICGKGAILALSLPVVKKILDLVGDLLP